MLNLLLMSLQAFLNIEFAASPNSKPSSTCNVSKDTNLFWEPLRTNTDREHRSSTQPIEIRSSLARKYHALGASANPDALLKIRKKHPNHKDHQGISDLLDKDRLVTRFYTAMNFSSLYQTPQTFNKALMVIHLTSIIISFRRIKGKVQGGL